MFRRYGLSGHLDESGQVDFVNGRHSESIQSDLTKILDGFEGHLMVAEIILVEYDYLLLRRVLDVVVDL